MHTRIWSDFQVILPKCLDLNFALPIKKVILGNLEVVHHQNKATCLSSREEFAFHAKAILPRN